MECEYCKNKSGFLDSRGNCASCGAPLIKRAYEWMETQVEADAKGYDMAICSSTCSVEVFDMNISYMLRK